MSKEKKLCAKRDKDSYFWVRVSKTSPVIELNWNTISLVRRLLYDSNNESVNKQHT